MSEETPTQKFRRVHRLTPLLRFWTLILALLAAAVLNLNASTFTSIWGFLSGEHEIAWIAVALAVGGFVVACLAIWLVSRVWWKATGFRITDEEVQMKRGVFSRQLRTARFDRIQAVDLVESIIARIFRVAAVRVETAGGGDSVIEIAFLPRAEAERVRAQLIDAASGEIAARPESGEETVGGADVDKPRVVDGDVVIPEIPIQRSLLSAALSGATIVLVPLLLIVVFTPLGIAFAIPVLLGLVPAVWGVVDRSWKFTARRKGDVLQVTYGLANRRNQSIPLERIHAVSIYQPILWRITGWWACAVSVAGYGAETKNGGTSKILPVGTLEQARTLLELVGPLSAEEIPEYASPEGITAASFTSPASAKWVSPVDRRQQGVTLVGEGAPRAVVVHRGRLRRYMAAIDPSHIQEVTLQRGPIQQRLDVSTVRMDLVPGPVSMSGEDISFADGVELVRILRTRSLPDMPDISELPAEVLEDYTRSTPGASELPSGEHGYELR